MKGKRPKKALWNKEELESLVKEAAVDCYNESEQVCGLYTMMENDLQLPFEFFAVNSPG